MISTPTRTRAAAILAATVAAFALAPAASAIAMPLRGPGSPAKAPVVSYTQSYWGASSNRPTAVHPAAPVVSYTQSYWGANPGATPTATPVVASVPSNAGSDWTTTDTAALVIGGIGVALIGLSIAPLRRRRALPTG